MMIMSDITEFMDDMFFVYVAYTIIFLGLAIYTFYLHQKQIKLTRDIEVLEESVRSYVKRKGKENEKEKRRRKQI
jgi:CcmD family protein